MKLLLTLHFENSFQEIYLPNVDNKVIDIDVKQSQTGFMDDFTLSLEVWSGEWFIVSTDCVELSAEGKTEKKIPVQPGPVIHCKHLPYGENFTIAIKEVPEQNTVFNKYKISRSSISVGKNASNIIKYEQDYVSGQHAIIQPNGTGWEVVDTSTNGTYINGKRVHNTQALRYGDIVYIMGLKIVCLGDILAINIMPGLTVGTGLTSLKTIECAITTHGGSEEYEEYYSRSPRQIEQLDVEAIELEAPPSPNIQRRQPLIFTIGPAFTMVIPMIAGILFSTWTIKSGNSQASPYIFMGIVTSVSAAIIGVSWALANYRYSRKMEASDEEKRKTYYSKYLEKIRGLIQTKHNNNRVILNRQYPAAEESSKWVLNKNRRLWERNVNQMDFLKVRIGYGNMPALNEVTVPKERFSLIDDTLAEEPYDIKREFTNLKNVPVCISLFENNLIGVLSENRKSVLDIMKSLTAQIAVSHAYTDVKLVYIFNKVEKDNFDFAKWLPHTWTSDGELRLIADDAASLGEVLYYLSTVMRDRVGENARKNKQGKALPHYVVFIADSELVEDEAMMKYLLSPSQEMGLTTVLLYGKIDRLPNNCSVIIQNDSTYSGYYSMDSSFEGFEDVSFDTLVTEQLDSLARALSEKRIKESQATGAIPQKITFLDMYKTSCAEDIDIWRRWLENRTFESMKAMVGFRAGNVPIYLDVHEKYHGPHGLVAGTTGSGKSEMLQSYILSLAVNYHPHEVSFILIDYKGGGMADSFKNLPHVAGIITNLGGNQTNRALASINSEIKRRQAEFRKYENVKHIDSYIELYRAGVALNPMPHLLIIADEFAELKKEQPEFVKELISASRVGRSLGVHLILATQKPAGVVDEEVWGNSKFRICLRVQDRQDSNDMIKRTDAAYITNAGRAFFQVGNNEIFEEFQSGWSGAKYIPEKKYADKSKSEVKMINLQGKKVVINTASDLSGDDEKKEDGRPKTQLEAVVGHINKIAAENSVPPIRNIWLPPLEKVIYLDEILLYTENACNRNSFVYPASPWEVRPVIGMADDPVNQRQIALQLNFISNGNLLVCGPGASGKTTCLQTILYSLVTMYSPARVNIYIADFGSRTFSVFAQLPHVGGIVFDDDSDKVDKMIALLIKELAARKLSFSERGIGTYKDYVHLYSDTPAVFFVIDNFARFYEQFSKHEDNLILLSREAASYGIYMVFASSAVQDIRNKIRQNFCSGIGLQMDDKYSYEAVIGERSDIVADDKSPGRGLIKDEKVVEFQTALCVRADESAPISSVLRDEFAKLSATWKGERAKTIPQIPRDLSYSSYIEYPEVKAALADANLIPIGYDLTEAELVSINLKKSYCFTVNGHERTGKTNMLRLIAKEAKLKGLRVYILDTPSRDMSGLSEEVKADGYASTEEETFGLMRDFLVPEFTRRNQMKAACTQRNNRQKLYEHMESCDKVIFIISDLAMFTEMVYSSQYAMNEFMEQVFSRGELHMIYFFSTLTPGVYSTINARQLVKNFVGWKDGIHMGGAVDQQRIFDFELTSMERSKRLSAGRGHINNGGCTKQLITPEV